MESKDEIILVKPSMEYEKQAKQMINEAKKYDEGNPDIWAGYSKMQDYENFNEWLNEIEKNSKKETVSPGRVQAAVYFSVRKSDNKIVGIINIRYELNQILLQHGGHIGYAIRATERRKGYGHTQLALGLEKCKERSIDKVLVTCRVHNVGSEKIIKSCGGLLEDIRYCEDQNDNFKRYWIDNK